MNKAIRKIESFLQTDGGQRLLQYGYSFGAAIVIFGAMVKVLHLWGVWGNIIFGTGMAIEVIVFILYGLDRPPKSYQWENVFPVLETENPEDRPNFEKGQGGTVIIGQPGAYAGQQSGTVSASEHQKSEVRPSPQRASHGIAQQPQAPAQSASQPVHGGVPYPAVGGDAVGDLSSVSENVMKFANATETLTKIAESLQDSYKHIIDNSQEIGQNTMGYVQQMEALNRNISGLNTIYEIQLKNISGQIDTLDEINRGLKSIREMYGNSVPDSLQFKEETEKMTQQIQELNRIYSRLIQAMTSNQNPLQ